MINHPAVVNLRTNQRQMDADGVTVSVSRQAVEETLALTEALFEAAAELEGWISRALVSSYTDRKPMPENLEAALTKIRAAILQARSA